MVLSIYLPVDLIYVFKHMWRGEKKDMCPLEWLPVASEWVTVLHIL